MPVSTTTRPAGSTQAPEPSRRRRFTGVLPNRLLHHRPPRLWQEALLIAIGYLLYGRVRNLVPSHRGLALQHGRAVQHLQEDLRLNFELSVNRFVADHQWLAQAMDYYYATLHFVITPVCLLWLFVAHSRVYRGARTVLFVTSLLALAGFWLYPLAPPRLLPQYGYIDTVLRFHTWGSLADPKIAQHSNQFAAMPSLHIGWALWCGAAIFFCARHLWVRLLGVLYPICTLAVIVGTANHFFIDAVAGLLVFLGGVGAQYLRSGRGAFHAAADGPDDAAGDATDRPDQAAAKPA